MICVMPFNSENNPQTRYVVANSFILFIYFLPLFFALTYGLLQPHDVLSLCIVFSSLNWRYSLDRVVLRMTFANRRSVSTWLTHSRYRSLPDSLPERPFY